MLMALFMVPSMAQDEYLTSCAGPHDYPFAYDNGITTLHYTVETILGDANFSWTATKQDGILIMSVIWGRNGSYYTGGTYNVRCWQTFLGAVMTSYEYQVTVMQENYIGSSVVTDVVKVIKATNSVRFQPGFHYTAVNSSYNLKGYLIDCSGNKVSSAASLKSATETKTVGILKGLNEIPGKTNEVVISPNPAQNMVRIQLPSVLVTYDISVVNSIGKQLYQKTHQENILDIDLSAYSKGMYIFKITGNDGTTVVKKVMKE
jgi:hypothetical protein